MTDETVSRQLIAQQADAAAQRSVLKGAIEENPYLPGTQAAAIWKTCFERYLLAHSAPDAEASA